MKAALWPFCFKDTALDWVGDGRHEPTQSNVKSLTCISTSHGVSLSLYGLWFLGLKIGSCTSNCKAILCIINGKKIICSREGKQAVFDSVSNGY